jgi:UDP-2-acetamido-3-amino-2,3-dideoxy-glucuronate N-acetyltransferase
MILIGVIGCGRQGRRLLDAFSSIQGCEIVTCFTESDDRKLAEVKKAHPHVKTTRQLKDVLSDDVDAAVIASPDPTHFSLISMVLDAGKHVFVEKPLASTYAEAAQLVERAARNGKALMAGHVMAFHPALDFIRRDAGRIRLVRSWRFDVGKPRPSSDAISGSLVHDVSMVARLIEGSVSSVKSDCVCSGNLVESVQAGISFSGGEKAFVSADLLSPTRGRVLTVLTSSKIYSFDGYTKVCTYEVEENGTKVELIDEKTVENDPIQRECAAFLELIKNGRGNPASGDKLLRVMSILESVRESALGGC